MKCAVCGFEEGAHDEAPEATFILVLGLLKTERTEGKTGNTFYQTTNLVACPECKTLRLSV